MASATIRSVTPVVLALLRLEPVTRESAKPVVTLVEKKLSSNSKRKDFLKQFRAKVLVPAVDRVSAAYHVGGLASFAQVAGSYALGANGVAWLLASLGADSVRSLLAEALYQCVPATAWDHLVSAVARQQLLHAVEDQAVEALTFVGVVPDTISEAMDNEIGRDWLRAQVLGTDTSGHGGAEAQHESASTRPTRVVVIGPCRAGKSALVATLSRAIAPHLETHSIEVTPCSLDDADSVQAVVWDCSGNHSLYLATQQYFMTRGAVYVLVIDPTQPEADWNLAIWLGHIQARAPGATVMIVATHADKLPDAAAVRDVQRRVMSHWQMHLEARDTSRSRSRSGNSSGSRSSASLARSRSRAGSRASASISSTAWRRSSGGSAHRRRSSASASAAIGSTSASPATGHRSRTSSHSGGQGTRSRSGSAIVRGDVIGNPALDDADWVPNPHWDHVAGLVVPPTLRLHSTPEKSCVFLVTALKDDRAMATLRSSLITAIAERSEAHLRIPRAYRDLIHVVEDHRASGTPYMLFADLALLARKRTSRLMDDDMVHHAVEWLVQSGDVVVQGDLIVLDPQWLARVFRTVVSNKSKFDVVRNGRVSSQALHQQWTEHSDYLYFNPALFQRMIQLLERFQLLMPDPLSPSDSFVVPSRLPALEIADLPAVVDHGIVARRWFVLPYPLHGAVPRVIAQSSSFARAIERVYSNAVLLLLKEDQRLLIYSRLLSSGRLVIAAEALVTSLHHLRFAAFHQTITLISRLISRFYPGLWHQCGLVVPVLRTPMARLGAALLAPESEITRVDVTNTRFDASGMSRASHRYSFSRVFPDYPAVRSLRKRLYASADALRALVSDRPEEALHVIGGVNAVIPHPLRVYLAHATSPATRKDDLIVQTDAHLAPRLSAPRLFASLEARPQLIDLFLDMMNLPRRPRARQIIHDRLEPGPFRLVPLSDLSMLVAGSVPPFTPPVHVLVALPGGSMTDMLAVLHPDHTHALHGLLGPHDRLPRELLRVHQGRTTYFIARWASSVLAVVIGASAAVVTAAVAELKPQYVVGITHGAVIPSIPGPPGVAPQAVSSAAPHVQVVRSVDGVAIDSHLSALLVGAVDGWHPPHLYVPIVAWSDIARDDSSFVSSVVEGAGDVPAVVLRGVVADAASSNDKAYASYLACDLVATAFARVVPQAPSQLPDPSKLGAASPRRTGSGKPQSKKPA